MTMATNHQRFMFHSLGRETVKHQPLWQNISQNSDETISLKALVDRVLARNAARNIPETASEKHETRHETEQVTASLETLDERAAIITANGVPEEWAVGFAKLCVMTKPAGYNERRWEQLVNDGGLFLDHFGGQAAALGWRAVDVFGVHPNVPATATHCMGLVPLINGGQVVAITADSARLQTPLGAIQTFQRRLAIPPNAIALWELTAKPNHNSP